MKQTTKKTKKSLPKKERWNDHHKALGHLMEKELDGLIEYLRSLHYLSFILIVTSSIGLIYAIRVLFENGQHAVVGFLVIIATCVSVIAASILSLRPWVLPRFLLPLDLAEHDLPSLLALFSSPSEYLETIHKHIQSLTEQFLIPKLRRLRWAISLLVFGMAIAVLLAIALP